MSRFLMIGTLLMACACLQVSAQNADNEERHEWIITPEEAAIKNPLQPTDENIQLGKSLFESQCAMCHGVNGDGKGDLAQQEKWDVPDYKKSARLKESSDGAIFAMITKGKGVMPDQEGRLTDDQKWKLVIYVRQLAK